MSKAAAAAKAAMSAPATPSAPAPPPTAPAAAPAAAPAPANVVQRQGELPKPSGAIDNTEPLVKQFERQYRTDFADTVDDAPAEREFASAAEVDAAAEGATADKAPKSDAARDEKGQFKPRKGMSARTSLDPDVEAADAAAAPVAPATAGTEEPATPATPVKVMTVEERRRALDALDAEDRRRREEQTLAGERQRIRDFETKLKGPLADRLLLAFPELQGTPDQRRDQLIEMLVSGQVALPEAGATPATQSAEDSELRKEVAALKAKLEGMDPASPAAQDAIATNRLRAIATDLQSKGVALPFSSNPGATIAVNGQMMTADQLRVKVTKATYQMQGNKGSVDGKRVVEVVEQAFEDYFVKQWGESAAAAIRGKPATAPTGQAAPVVTAPAAQQRRGNGGKRGAHSGTAGGDPLPMNHAARHRAMMAEIDAMEGNLRAGPR